MFTGSRILLGMMILVSIQAIIAFIRNGFVFSNFRPSLTFGNVNFMACYFIALLPLVYILPFNKYETDFKFIKEKKFLLFIPAAFAATLPLIFSQTRAAWLGFYISIFFLFIPCFFIILFNLNIKKGVIVFLTFFVLSIVIPVLVLNLPVPFISDITVRISDTIKNPLFDIQNRLVGWTGGLALFKKYPLLGGGMGSVYAASYDYIDKYFRIYVSTNNFSHSHSEYIELLGEGGIPALLIFLGLNFYIICRLSVISIKKSENIRIRLYALAVLSGLVAVLIQQIFSLTLRMPVSMAAYYSLLAISVFIINQYSAEGILIKNRNNILKRNSVIFFLAILILGGSRLFFPLFRMEYLLQMGYTSTYRNEANAYIDKAVKSYPDNILVLLKKMELDVHNILYSDQERKVLSKNGLDEIEKTLNKLARIHPGIHNLNKLFTDLYINKFKYYIVQNDEISKIIAHECLDKAYIYASRSLDQDFLLKSTHLQRLFLAKVLNDNDEMEILIKEYIEASIYLEFCKKYSVLKSKVDILFTDNLNDSYVRIDNSGRYVFKIKNDFVTNLASLIILMPEPDEKLMKDKIIKIADDAVDNLCN
ncbi:MAG: O-antigen ligase family protein [Spirochaetes bacterium]|nr:O-antigen ligase family protein [Spirochaetota bacterium]